MIPLTPRQLEILRCSAMPNRQAALKLKICEQRVKAIHITIYKKLEVHGENSTKKLRAITKALRLGIVDIDELDFDFRTRLV